MRRHEYALIIIDPGMPDGDGLEFINELEKQSGVNPEFIILSAEEIPAFYHARAQLSLVKSTISEEYIAACVLNIIEERKAA
ncbi:MAG: hypothetical protein DHS20C05_25850 [Hyphococcus sp.]|nr:MAG: hypothetical protein DHS20C05_25850 [Marinicaulis sp.]